MDSGRHCCDLHPLHLRRLGRRWRSGCVIAESEKNAVDDHPVDGAIFVLEGEAHVHTSDGDLTVLRPGDFVSFENGVKQTWDIVERFKAVVVFLG